MNDLKDHSESLRRLEVPIVNDTRLLTQLLYRADNYYSHSSLCDWSCLPFRPAENWDPRFSPRFGSGLPHTQIAHREIP